jgi:hypothetical protein
MKFRAIKILNPVSAFGITKTHSVLYIPMPRNNIYVGISPPLKNIVIKIMVVNERRNGRALKERTYAAHIVRNTDIVVPNTVRRILLLKARRRVLLLNRILYAAALKSLGNSFIPIDPAY